MANVIGQIYFIDVFLGGEFLQYGTEVLKFHLFKDPQGMYHLSFYSVKPSLTHTTGRQNIIHEKWGSDIKSISNPGRRLSMIYQHSHSKAL